MSKTMNHMMKTEESNWHRPPDPNYELMISSDPYSDKWYDEINDLTKEDKDERELLHRAF